MKKELERLLIYLIPAIFMEKILGIYASRILAGMFDSKNTAFKSLIEKFPEHTPGEIITYVNIANVLIGIIPLIVIAIWLWKIEKASKGKPILWAIGALVLNYWILLLFIGQRIYEREYKVVQQTT